jgi:hypothetical protein
MPDQDPCALQFSEHAGGHLTGESAVVLLGDILRTPGDAAAGQIPGHLRDVGKRRADGDFNLAGGRAASAQRRDQTLIAGRITVHLPVANDQWPAQGRSGGRSCRSRI